MCRAAYLLPDLVRHDLLHLVNHELTPAPLCPQLRPQLPDDGIPLVLVLAMAHRGH